MSEHDAIHLLFHIACLKLLNIPVENKKINNEEHCADKYVQRNRRQVAGPLHLSVSEAQFPGLGYQCFHGLQKLGIIVKIVGNKMHNHTPKGLFVQVSSLPALRAIIARGSCPAVGAGDGRKF